MPAFDCPLSKLPNWPKRTPGYEPLPSWIREENVEPLCLLKPVPILNSQASHHFTRHWEFQQKQNTNSTRNQAKADDRLPLGKKMASWHTLDEEMQQKILAWIEKGEQDSWGNKRKFQDPLKQTRIDVATEQPQNAQIYHWINTNNLKNNENHHPNSHNFKSAPQTPSTRNNHWSNKEPRQWTRTNGIRTKR